MTEAKATVLCLGRVLHQLRARRGLAQGDLQKRLGAGFTQGNISRIEAGLIAGVHIEHVALFARALDTTPEELMALTLDAVATGRRVAEATLGGERPGWERCARLGRAALVGLADFGAGTALAARFGPAPV